MLYDSNEKMLFVFAQWDSVAIVAFIYIADYPTIYQIRELKASKGSISQFMSISFKDSAAFIAG